LKIVATSGCAVGGTPQGPARSAAVPGLTAARGASYRPHDVMALRKPPRPPALPPQAPSPTAPTASVGTRPPAPAVSPKQERETFRSIGLDDEDAATAPNLPPRVSKAHPLVGADGKLAKRELVEQYTPFVRSIAAKIKKGLAKSIEFDDLIAYGMTGLLEAAERYDPKMGANFMTFSYYRIRGSIYDGLRGMGWVSRSEYQKIRFEERATQYLENMASREVVGGDTNKSVEDNIEELANQVSQLVTIYVTSLEAMEDLQVEDKERQPLDERFADVEMKAHVREALARLPEADREIVVLYYFKELSLQEVGNRLGLSKSWTSRRHAQAIDRLTRTLQEIMRELPPPPPKTPARTAAPPRR
jgi:RNA polymerase sigma factor for flagellar operon FliA